MDDVENMKKCSKCRKEVEMDDMEATVLYGEGNEKCNINETDVDDNASVTSSDSNVSTDQNTEQKKESVENTPQKTTTFAGSNVKASEEKIESIYNAPQKSNTSAFPTHAIASDYEANGNLNTEENNKSVEHGPRKSTTSDGSTGPTGAASDSETKGKWGGSENWM